MPLTPESIANIEDFDQLLEYFGEELKWPLVFDPALEDIADVYSASELQILPATEKQLAGGVVHGLQKMVEDQPWGIFFVQFDNGAISVQALRDVLRRLVSKSAGRQAFAADDLLFVCATKDFQHFAFVHFQKRGAGQPLFETFGWTRGDAHLRTLCEFNLERLRWHDAFEADANKWRDAWRSAFDVSAVTSRFFTQYEERFRAVETKVKGFEPPHGATQAVKDEWEEKRNAWTQKLFNRLLFVAFLQKKGWMTPPATAPNGRNYLESLWHDYVARKEELEAESFFTSRLKPLFVALNTFNAKLDFLVGDVPYLNGGLFDTEEDGRTDPPDVQVEDKVIQDIIFELFARYNFTVEESTPLDVQVAVDPEMLGKVFEKLILKRDRKAGGSFYTPRVIVTFMCREALKRYLGDKYAPLIECGDVSGISVEEAGDLLDKLAAVRVVDPACGSGAYLLGMLHELFVLNKKLDTTARRANARDDYKRKLDIIQNNLFGVDLDDFAVHIARLRLWLSLVVEFDTASGEKPDPLPNLDFKIETGDSLTAPNPSAITLQREEYLKLAAQLFELEKEWFEEGEKERGVKVSEQGHK
ncbi:MAG: hypothetical protein JO316_25830 [Abitibacteriaceae bacterium]|nr:hypothetical protein [Abditibacteriaceae bacterium]MBV9868793.1 hypothetical protein [Abditibacteriaceae bacterium]